MQRVLVRALREIAAERGILLETFSGDWVLRLEREGAVRHVIGFQFDLNPAAAARAATDKCAAAALLERADVPCVAHELFLHPRLDRHVPPEGNAPRLDRLAYPLVCKPNEGTGGLDVVKVDHRRELEAALQDLFTRERAVSVSPYHPVDNEYRAVVLEGAVELLYEKRPAPGEWKHNLSADAEPVAAADPEVERLARAAAAACGLRFVSVDVIRSKGRLLVLEMNSGVMLELFAQRFPDGYEIAKRIYARAVELMFA